MSNRFRNRFLAFICLLAFLGVGVLFYVHWVVQKPFAIIVFLTDDLTSSSLTAARIYEGGADYRLHLEGLKHLGLLTTHANDFAVSDTAAATTAIATGQKVNNRLVGVDSSGKPLNNFLDLARKSGRTVGLITNGQIPDVTPAAFFAKGGDARDPQAIALQLLDTANFDVLLGGGESYFLPEHKDGQRKDGRDLMLELRRKGYDIVRNKSELENTPFWKSPKLFGIFARDNMAYVDEIEAASSQPTLAEMVQSAIQILQFNTRGYVLVVDAGLVGRAASENKGERTLRELLSLDEAVATAVNYAGENSLIIVAGKQSVGGLRMNGYPFRNDKGMAVVGINAQGMPSLTWSTGPGSQTPAVATSGTTTGTPSTEPSAVISPAAVGVAEDTIVVGSGPGAEKLEGFKDNTDIFKVISDNL